MRSKEFWLAVDCCRHSFRRNSGIAATLPEDVHWQHFLEIVRFHRIEGIAWDCLSCHNSQLPEQVADELQLAALKIAANNLRAAQICLALRDSCREAEVPLLFLKGLSVGALAYAKPAVKSSIDIDLLIDPEHVLPAAAILRKNGFQLVAPAKSRDDQTLREWHRSWKESVWYSVHTKMQIDLHTRTSDNWRLIPRITVWSPRQDVQVGDGIVLPTFADEELFAYLAVHGASSAWFRLKWAADFAGFLSGKSAEAIEYLYRSSQRLDAGRAPALALLLANDLFGTLNRNPDLQRELNRDHGTTRLHRTSLKLLTRRPVEPTSIRFGTLPIHTTQLLLRPEFSYKLAETARQVRRLFNRPPA